MTSRLSDERVCLRIWRTRLFPVAFCSGFPYATVSSSLERVTCSMCNRLFRERADRVEWHGGYAVEFSK